jgi:hypothetical protein
VARNDDRRPRISARGESDLEDLRRLIARTGEREEDIFDAFIDSAITARLNPKAIQPRVELVASSNGHGGS